MTASRVRALPPFAVPVGADPDNPAVRLFLQRAPGLAARPTTGVGRACLPPARRAAAGDRARRRPGWRLGLPLLIDRLGGRLDLLRGGRRTADRGTGRCGPSWSGRTAC